MYTNYKYIFSMFVLMIITSCDLRDGYNDCGITLEFIFDHNMEYANSFVSQVKTVDVYIFDENDKFLFSKHADCEKDLENGNQMYLRNEIVLGTYKIITIGGLSENFIFTECVPGKTTVEQVELALKRYTSEISHEFPHIYFGETATINYKVNQAVCPIYMIRNTNKFNLVLFDMDETEVLDENVLYTFSILAPEAGVYGHDNSPLKMEEVKYTPYHLQSGDIPGNLSEGKINTMRLFSDNSLQYKLLIHDTRTSEEIWSYDLINLLEKTKPANRPDGTKLPMQEYLDRQGEWNIVVLYRTRIIGGEESLLALGIRINGWVIWFNDIEV